MGASDAASTSPPTTCWATFSVNGALIDGVIVQNVVIGGDAAALGGWDPSMALDMSAVAGAVGVWTIAVPLASGSTVHFKFGMSGGGGLTWEADGAVERPVPLRLLSGRWRCLLRRAVQPDRRGRRTVSASARVPLPRPLDCNPAEARGDYDADSSFPISSVQRPAKASDVSEVGFAGRC